MSEQVPTEQPDIVVENVRVAEEPVATGEQPVDTDDGGSPDKEKLKVDALAFADKLYPVFAGMALDPLCAAVGSSYRCENDKRRLPCTIAVFIDHGKETAKLVEKHPLKVVLFGIAKVFPGVMKLSENDRIETVVTIIFTLNAMVALSLGVYAGMMPVESPNTVETPINETVNAEPAKPPRKRGKKVR